MKRFYLLLFVGFISIAISCSNNTDDKSTLANKDSIHVKANSYLDISQEEFHNLASKIDSNTIILDVRTSREFENGNIPNSINIDFNASNFQDQISDLDSTKTYLVYCQIGVRSSAAAKLMVQNLGFENVKNLEGGYSSWNSGK